MPTDPQRLAEADACHDEQPGRAAALLRTIDPAALADGERPTLAFLLNHVLGEKLGAWAEVQRLQAQVLNAAGEAAPPVLWRQCGAAARNNGDGEAAERAANGLARATQTSIEQAHQLIVLTATTFAAPTALPRDTGSAALEALAALDTPPWQAASALDAAAAAACNNLAASLSERPLEDLREPALRAALLRAARCSQRLWQRAGDWVNHERAWYAVAVAEGAAGDASRQHDAAAAGLALLDANDGAGEQNVDRAFLQLELAHALARLQRTREAGAARARADALAAAFADAALERWYNERVERHARLPQR